MNRTLLIPVENQVRELDAKLLFSCVAAERGFPVVLGSKQFLYFMIPRLGRSVFVAKSMRKRSALMFNIVRGLGNDIVAWDEESLVRYESPEYYSWRFSEASFEPLSHLFSWGADDAEMFSNYSKIGDTPVHATGNPRADLLRADVRDYFADEKQRLRDLYGDFILVNTNFSFVNPFVKKLTLVSDSGAHSERIVGRTGSGMSAEFAGGMAEHQQQIFDHFKLLLPRLAEWFPEHRIIIRPHPSEDHGVWRRLLSDFDNVEIIHEGNVVPWLMATRVLLHNGCTTAVEAAALETPAITYQPVRADCFDYHLPNSVSRRALTADEVRTHVQAVLAGEPGDPSPELIREILGRHLAASTGRLGSDRILDVLIEAGYDTIPQSRPPMLRYARAYLTAQIRTALKRFNMPRPDHWNSSRYHSHRFPEISAAEINNRIGRFTKVLGRFNGVTATQVSEHVFEIAKL